MDLSLIRDISILIGIWVAIYGIDFWRREFRGKRQIELAEEALALFYEASDAIAYIRNPFALPHELESVERDQNETEAQFKVRKTASVVFYRYNQRNELFSHIHAMRYRFMAAFGKKKAAPFDELNNVVNEIILAARMLGRMWAREYYRDDKSRDEHRQLVEKYESIIWFQGAEDRINTRIDSIIAEIETTCRDIILGKGTIYYFINWKRRIND